MRFIEGVIAGLIIPFVFPDFYRDLINKIKGYLGKIIKEEPKNGV